jgi:D-xylulose reductase
MPCPAVRTISRAPFLLRSDMYRHGGIGKAVVTQPMVLGHESAGVVYQLGSEVRGLKIGQKVAIEPGRPVSVGCLSSYARQCNTQPLVGQCKSCSNCKTGRTNLCYNLRHCCVPPDHGSLSQFYATTPEFLVPIPEGISWEEAGCIQPLAVAIQLAKRANFTVGQTLAVL